MKDKGKSRKRLFTQVQVEMKELTGTKNRKTVGRKKRLENFHPLTHIKQK
jgi:hypothetical protein